MKARDKKTMRVAFQEHPVLGYTVGLTSSLTRLGVKINLFEKKQSFRFPIANFKMKHLSSFFFLTLNHPDIIHLNFCSRAWAALKVARIFGIPIIYTCHFIPHPEPVPLENFIDPDIEFNKREKRLIPLVATHSFKTVTLSDYAKRLLKEMFGITSDVIHYGVDIKKFNPRITGRRVRKQLGLRDEKIVLWVSRFGLHAYKDPFTFIQAIPLITKKYHNIKFIMIGQGPLLPYAISMAVKLGVMQNGSLKIIRVQSPVGALPYNSSLSLNEYYKAADVFTLTSFNDTFGLVLLEAMACGTPVVASNSGAPPEVVGDAGLLFEYGNPRDLSEKIILLLEDEELARQLRKRAIKRVLQHFTWDKVAERYLKIYRYAMD